MPDGRVLADSTAENASRKFLNTVNNELPNSLKALTDAGRDLADPQHWDGRVAQDFRSNVWPKVQSDLTRMQASLKDLQGQVDKILGDIMKAGGNG
jgi:hypothetical protein